MKHLLPFLLMLLSIGAQAQEKTSTAQTVDLSQIEEAGDKLVSYSTTFYICLTGEVMGAGLLLSGMRGFLFEDNSTYMVMGGASLMLAGTIVQIFNVSKIGSAGRALQRSVRQTPVSLAPAAQGLGLALRF